MEWGDAGAGVMRYNVFDFVWGFLLIGADTQLYVSYVVHVNIFSC